MKKLSTTIISSMLVFLLILTGCTSKGEKGTASSNTTGKTTEEKVTPPGTFPIVKEKQNLVVFAPQDPYVEDYNTNEFTKWYEEKTNIHVVWEIVPAAGLKEKVQLKLAGSDLPDVFLQSQITDASLVMYGSQGLFIPLNDLIEKYAPNVKNMLKKSPYVQDFMVTPNGNIYHIPNVGEVFHSTMPKKAWIYKPWLDTMGLKVPTTTEEFYETLKAFKTRDPNGNGKADEVPLAGADGEKNGNNEIESYLMQSFLFYERGNYLMNNNGKIEFAADKPEYKDALRYIKKLIDEKLLLAESFTQDRKALTALGEDPGGCRLGAATSLYWAHFTVDKGPSGRYKEYVPLPVLKGPSGKAFGYDRGYSPSIGSGIGTFVITKNCKIPEAAMRWMDTIYDLEKDLELEFNPSMGKPGIGWKRPDPGTKGIDGRPATYEAIVTFGTKQNVHWSQTLNGYNSNDYRLSGSAKDEIEVRLYNATKDLYKPFSALNQKVPFMFLSEEQLTKTGDLRTAMHKVVQTFMVKFVTGNLDLDKDWNTYLKELENAGVKEYVKVTQDAYNENQKAKKK